MSRTRPAKKIKQESEISSTPVCDDLVVSGWVDLPGDVLAWIVELAQQEHDEDNAGGPELAHSASLRSDSGSVAD
jgi:predicted alpha-1,6-mannanase (GH76 family)